MIALDPHLPRRDGPPIADGIGRRLIVALIAFSSLITGVTTALQLYGDYRSDVRGIEENFSFIRNSYLPVLVDSVWVSDEDQIRTQLGGLLRLRDMEHLAITVDGNARWQSGARQSARVLNERVELFHSYQGRNVSIGMLEMSASVDNVLDRLLGRLLTVLMDNAIKTVLVAGFMLLILRRLVTRHIDRLARYAGALDLAGLDAADVALDRTSGGRWRPDVLDDLTNALNTMRRNLGQAWDQQRRSAEVARRSEENLRVTLESIGDAVIATDAAGGVTIMNSVAEALTGWRRNDARNRPIEEVFRIVDERTRQAAQNPVQRVLEEGSVVSLANHTLLIARDGVERPIADSGAPIRLEADGAVMGVVLVFRDQTEERRRLIALQSSEARLRAVVNQAAVGIARVGLDGRWLEANQKLCEITGYEPEELRELTFGQITHPQDIEADLVQARRLRDGEIESFTLEKRYLRKDGEAVWVNLTASAVRDQEGAPQYYIGIVEDIARRKRAEADMARLTDELELRVRERTADLSAAVRELESFSYSVSHDLRAPLRAINGYSRLLLDGEGDCLKGDSRALLERVIANTTRMERLIDDILEYSRAGRRPYARSAVDLDHLVRGVAAEWQEAYPQAAFSIGPLPPVSGDPAMLRQILANLIGNACKFSSQRERPLIEVGSLQQGGETVFFVRDNGAGFDMRYAGKLFGMFQRMHRDSQFPGTGVGLAVVKRLVERHRGRVWAEAQPDQGAVFYFTLSA